MNRHGQEADPLADRELERARELVLALGWNTTSYQILNPGFRRWFTARDDAVVGFVQHGSFRVAAGGPIAEKERILDAAHEFERASREVSRTVCWFGSEERFVRAREAAGDPTDRVALGAQPAWAPDEFLTRFHGKASLRAQKNRAGNKGLEVREWSASEATSHPSLVRCLEEWLANRTLPAMRFLVEPRILGRLRDRRVFVAHAATGIRGFLVATPIPARDGWLVEEIVRGHEAPNGTAELLLEGAVARLAADGAELVTLGLAPLSSRARAPRAPRPWIRFLLGWVRTHSRRFYDFDGLERFKAKFRPERWEPVFAVTPDRRFGLRDLWAIGAAFSGGSPVRFLLRGTGKALRQEAFWLRRWLRSRG